MLGIGSDLHRKHPVSCVCGRFSAGGRCLFDAVPTLEQHGLVFMEFNEIDAIFDPDVGEGIHAVVSDPVDPCHAIFDVAGRGAARVGVGIANLTSLLESISM